VAAVPVIGWFVSMVGSILVWILFIMEIINAAGGQEKPLPIIGSYADKFNI
jgi:uncharacterized membrane protein